MTNFWLYPTLIAALNFCPRYLYLTYYVPYSGGITSYSTVSGKLEHDVFEYFEKKTREAWLNLGVLSASSAQIVNERIENVLAYAKATAVDNNPQFLNFIDKTILTLRYRLLLFHKNLFDSATPLMKNGYSLNEVVSQLLAWKIEEKITDYKLGITGKIDLIYNPSDFLKIRDIKSHINRFDAFIHQNETITQLACYGVLSESKWKKPVHELEIFYSQNLEVEKFDFTDKMRTDIQDSVGIAREILQKPIPPKLEGADAVKCQFCYKQKVCFGTADDSTDLMDNFEAKSKGGFT